LQSQSELIKAENSSNSTTAAVAGLKRP